MKKHFRIALMAATAIALTGLTACNKGGDVPDAGEPRPATLKINLVNPTNSNSRVAGSAPGTRPISNFTIFIIDGDDNVGWTAYSDTGNNETYIEVTTDAKAAYAIANAGDQSANYTTRAALEAAGPLVSALEPQYTNLWASGFADGSGWNFQTADSGDANDYMEQEVTLDLKYIAARIVVTVDNNMTGYTNEVGNTVHINSVAVLNARGQSRLFPTSGDSSGSLIPNQYDSTKKYVQGLSDDGFDHFPNSTDYLMDEENLVNTYEYSGTSDKTYYFYVFENDSDEQVQGEYPTIVTLVGMDATNEHKIYFPVHFASYETWADNGSGYAGGIKRGNSYNVKITLNGNAASGNGGGSLDPTVSVNNVDVDATISITEWNAINLEKNF